MVDSCLGATRGRPPKSTGSNTNALLNNPSGTRDSRISEGTSVNESEINPLSLSTSNNCAATNETPLEYLPNSDGILFDEPDTEIPSRNCSTPVFSSEPNPITQIQPRYLSYDPENIPDSATIFDLFLLSQPSKNIPANENQFFIPTAPSNSVSQNSTSNTGTHLHTMATLQSSLQGPPCTQCCQLNPSNASTSTCMNASSSSTMSSSSQTTLDSSSIMTELPENPDQYFLLDMSQWQKDSTQFGTVFTGPNGETFLPPYSFAKLDTFTNELMQSEYWTLQYISRYGAGIVHYSTS